MTEIFNVLLAAVSWAIAGYLWGVVSERRRFERRLRMLVEPLAHAGEMVAKLMKEEKQPEEKEMN